MTPEHLMIYTYTVCIGGVRPRARRRRGRVSPRALRASGGRLLRVGEAGRVVERHGPACRGPHREAGRGVILSARALRLPIPRRGLRGAHRLRRRRRAAPDSAALGARRRPRGVRWQALHLPRAAPDPGRLDGRGLGACPRWLRPHGPAPRAVHLQGGAVVAGDAGEQRQPARPQILLLSARLLGLAAQRDGWRPRLREIRHVSRHAAFRPGTEPAAAAAARRKKDNGVLGACTCESMCATATCPCKAASKDCGPACHAPQPGAKRPAVVAMADDFGGQKCRNHPAGEAAVKRQRVRNKAAAQEEARPRARA